LVECGDRECKVLCPAHPDVKPSLSVKDLGKDGLLLHCHAGCLYSQIIEALGALEVSAPQPAVKLQLKPETEETQAFSPDTLEWFSTYTGVPTSFLLSLGRNIAFAQKEIRFLFPGVKAAKYRKARAKEFWWIQDGGDRPPFWPLPPKTLPTRIFLATGETDCISLKSLGYDAFALTAGEGAMPELAALRVLYDRGVREIVYVPDLDEAGQRKIPILQERIEDAEISFLEINLASQRDPLIGEKDAKGVVSRLLDSIEAGDIKKILDSLVAQPTQLEERFPTVDLGALMLAGIPPRPFLIPDLIYKDRCMVLHGPSGDGKTMISLALCSEMIKAGETVFYCDEENGEDEIAKRLMGLGLTPTQVTNQFLYFPLTSPSLKEADSLLRRIVGFNPVWGVFDSGADFYTAAGLKENDNDDMVTWFKAFVQPLSRTYQIGSLLLDHENAVGEEGKPRGASSKKQKTDASWHIKVTKPFDQDTIGEVEFERKKNRHGSLPPLRKARIGGDGQGNIDFHLYPTVVTPTVSQQQAHANAKRMQYWWTEVDKVLRQAGCVDASSGLSQSKLFSALPSGLGQADKTQMMQDCADSPLSKVKRQVFGPRKTITYWVV
jgi:hypothetical protein